MPNAPLDVVLYGATGFVGRQTVAYFAAHAGGLRWALAGRNYDKLAAVRANAGPGATDAGIVVADASDGQALAALAGDARVVLSTAGPFALHGSLLVAACVAQRTHYVDITGETPWVRELIDRHHEHAMADGTRIIPCCGFDSVPSDLGAWLAVTALRERHAKLLPPAVGALVFCHLAEACDDQGGTPEQVLAYYRAARGLDPDCRPAVEGMKALGRRIGAIHRRAGAPLHLHGDSCRRGCARRAKRGRNLQRPNSRAPAG